MVLLSSQCLLDLTLAYRKSWPPSSKLRSAWEPADYFERCILNQRTQSLSVPRRNSSRSLVLVRIPKLKRPSLGSPRIVREKCRCASSREGWPERKLLHRELETISRYMGTSLMDFVDTFRPQVLRSLQLIHRLQSLRFLPQESLLIIILSRSP
jgi:hypothetical protein